MPQDIFSFVTSKILLERVAKRYEAWQSDLSFLGFREMGVYYDRCQPYDLLKSLDNFKSFLLMRKMNEQVILRWPFTYSMLCPLFYHAETGTYASLLGLGCRFYTLLPEDVLYVTASWPGPNFECPESKFFKRYTGAPPRCGGNFIKNLKANSDRSSPLTSSFMAHSNWLNDVGAKTPEANFCPSLPDFDRITALENERWIR